MDKNELQDRLKALALSRENEDLKTWSVLYWKAQGLTHDKIAILLERGKDWVQRYITRTYRIFGVTTWDDVKKRNWMDTELLPALEDLLKADPYLFKAPPKLPPELPSEIKGEEKKE